MMVSITKLIYYYKIDGLVPERSNSIGNALELRLPCTNLLKYDCLKATEITLNNIGKISDF